MSPNFLEIIVFINQDKGILGNASENDSEYFPEGQKGICGPHQNEPKGQGI